jgi:hypothetical protein
MQQTIRWPRRWVLRKLFGLSAYATWPVGKQGSIENPLCQDRCRHPMR